MDGTRTITVVGADPRREIRGAAGAGEPAWRRRCYDLDLNASGLAPVDCSEVARS
jgi:hypothetical protein